MQRPKPETVTLNDILITEELSRRSPRPPNWQAQAEAMQLLATQMARDSESLMQTLVDTALELCQAGTAGVSLLETTPNGEEIFRWTVLAGTLAHHVGDSTHRSFSPCGVCLEQGSPVLLSYPERYFTYFQEANTPIVEGLVLPLIADRHVFGTIWIMSHDEGRHFDSEEVRIMTSLADFTATTLLLQQRQTRELLAANAALEAEMAERKQVEARTQALISNLPGGAAFVVDHDLRYLLAEGEALATAGFKPKDFVGRTIFEVLSPELATSYEPMYRQALAGEPFEHEHNAHDHTYASRGTPLRAENGEIYAVLVVSYDISDRRQAEEQLRCAAEFDAFSVVLNDAVRSLSDPEEIKYQAACVLGQHLGTDRAYYVEIDEARSEFVVARDWHQPGAPSHARRYPLDGWPMPWLVDGQPWVVRDVDSDSAMPDDQRESYRGNDIDALIVVPLIKNGRLVATLATNQHTPRDWTPKEVELVQETAERTWAAVERAYAEELLRVSEQKYRSLFNSIDEGFCIVERIEGELINFRYIEANPAFAVQTGISDIVGKTIREAFADAPEAGYEIYENVLKTGEPIRFEIDVFSLERILEIYAFRIDGEARLAVIFKDITSRKRAEAQLRHAAEMDAFRVKLSDALRLLTDSTEIQYQAARLLGEHLGVDRAYYVEVNEAEGYSRINQDYVRGNSSSLVGTFRLAEYGWSVPYLRRGETLIVANTQTDNIVPDGDRELMAAIGIISHISLPLIKAGELVGALCVTEAVPREWSTAEVELMRETAERIWATIERARAEAALHESEIQRVREQSAREQERQRAEALAELDRAKTLFFSNISHEFRTPLTLLLAPLQDALESVEAWEREGTGDLTLSPSYSPIPSLKEHLQLARRNSLRLLKLVNTLLDFSRIEVGRIEAVYEPTDLAQVTTDLASVFRSAIERAGLRLIVDCPPLSEPVYIDREMWEKIVLNLLSNALKFTFSGEITVSFHPNDRNQAILQIRDTGGGIAPEHLPHLFERFYQVRGAQARTHEGSGIGLALVNELVQLQGGAIAVSSTVGKGTCFTISLPFGTAHLPSERIQATRTLTSTGLGADLYVEEAERWLLREGNREWGTRGSLWGLGVMGNGKNQSSPTPSTARVLIVDDNADMRQYLTRILSEHVHVEVVADGTAAMAAIQTQPPDLVLSDVMMPRLDGFGLLQTLRADPRTREVPIILLSARAGEEAISEGLDAGADDYLIKPFSAQELVSRVNAHLQISFLRGEALLEARTAMRRKDELLSVVSHELNTPLVSILGWTRLLRSNPSNPAMLSKALDTIERSATMQAKLVQDLLDVSRITADKLRLNLQPVELESVIEAAIATLTQIAAEAGIRLTWTETAAAVVMGDRERLQQVVCNLLTNAIKFTPKGGRVEVCLSLVTGYGALIEDEELVTNDNYAEIRVTDTGIGIAADFLPHVFEQFRQAKGSTSAKGLGLGLAIAQHLVELHNGTIHAQSAGAGQGATFIVKLPLLKPDG